MDAIKINAADETWGVALGPVTLHTHSADVCADDPACCIHKPSNHPLRDSMLNWRADRGLMERICDHGIGHPDPDDLAHKRRTLTPEQYRGHAYESHGCDGCCG